MLDAIIRLKVKVRIHRIKQVKASLKFIAITNRLLMSNNCHPVIKQPKEYNKYRLSIGRLKTLKILLDSDKFFQVKLHQCKLFRNDMKVNFDFAIICLNAFDFWLIQQ